MKKRQPTNKLLRKLKYCHIQATRANMRDIRKVEEEWKHGKCEYCGRTGREVSICAKCNRCYDRSCNAGCIFCNPPKYPTYCDACGQEIEV